MPYYEFEKKDLLVNTVELNPYCSFLIYGPNAYYNNLEQSIVNSNTPTGNISLYELNVNRATDNLIYPFLPKGSSLEMFRSISTSEFVATDVGTILTGSYPLTATMQTAVYDTSAARPQIDALKSILNYYKNHSAHYAFSSSLGDKGTQRLTLIDFPSIFYGSKIQKGTVDLRFYISGSLIGKLTDKNRNGELIQSSGTISANDDKVGGVVLYNEGLVILTGSWDLNTVHTAKYVDDGGSTINPRWNAFGRKTYETVSSSYGVDIQGVQEVNIFTMFAHAQPGTLNYSPNPTYAQKSDSVSSLATHVTSSGVYYEYSNRGLINTVSSSFIGYSEEFKKQTFISKIGIFDKNKNLIAIAKLATPVRKQENDDYTFKLKLDY